MRHRRRGRGSRRFAKHKGGKRLFGKYKVPRGGVRL